MQKKNWQIHNNEIYRIVINLLNLQETYKLENKAVEFAGASCILCEWLCDGVFGISCTGYVQVVYM